MVPGMSGVEPYHNNEPSVLRMDGAGLVESSYVACGGNKGLGGQATTGPTEGHTGGAQKP